MAQSNLPNTTHSIYGGYSTHDEDQNGIIHHSFDLSDISESIFSIQPGPNSQLNSVISRMAHGASHTRMDSLSSSEEPSSYMMPTKALLDELEGMTSFQILLALDTNLARISNTQGSLNAEKMTELLKIIIELMKHVRDANYDEITVGYKYDEFNMKMQVKCLNKIKAYIESLSMYVTDSNYKSILEKEYLRITNFIIVRHNHNRILNFHDSKGCNADYSDNCKYYLKKGMIPVIDWRKSTIAQRINESTSVQDILSENTEQCCPVCLAEDINEDLNFAILDSCHHLTCCRCAETVFYKFDDEEQQR